MFCLGFLGAFFFCKMKYGPLAAAGKCLPCPLCSHPLQKGSPAPSGERPVAGLGKFEPELVCLGLTFPAGVSGLSPNLKSKLQPNTFEVGNEALKHY